MNIAEDVGWHEERIRLHNRTWRPVAQLRRAVRLCTTSPTRLARARRSLVLRLAAAHEELLAKHGALYDAASKLAIAVRSGRGVTEALATLELVLDPEGEEVTGG